MATKYFSLLAGLGATLTLAILSYLEVFTQTGLWLMAPFGATTVLVFGVPASPLAQPKNVILGHLLSASVGLVFVTYVGVYPWSLALATGLAITLMLATKTTHPPAGANPMLIMMTGQSWSFLLSPVLSGVLIIVVMGYLVNKSLQRYLSVKA
ncbi:HPP family protein [Thalassomonas actiniarum]|uniref:HPP family protein n=1 Tax=Thalassomonas actiniarum TaxID=485447 RepID=A0AAE9YL47_9GAMM|nr:HPP family protein [Thalassomonas actiniarum]WDD97350.1 HPP family protein [Thalassomonas actiniarum]